MYAMEHSGGGKDFTRDGDGDGGRAFPAYCSGRECRHHKGAETQGTEDNRVAPIPTTMISSAAVLQVIETRDPPSG